MRFGLFGGTFNPVHLGHLRAALEVKEGFGLDEIFLIPAAIPPHKIPGEVVDAADRLQMLKLAVENAAGLSVSDVELKRSGLSYTIDTVYHFKRCLPKNSRIYLIMGIDAFLEINSWRSYAQLTAEIPIIVINRPKAGRRAGDVEWKIVGDYLRSNLPANYEFSDSQSCFLAKDQKPVYVFEVTAMDISSTRIRNLIREGRSIGYLMPQKAIEYLNAKGLYL